MLTHEQKQELIGERVKMRKEVDNIMEDFSSGALNGEDLETLLMKQVGVVDELIKKIDEFAYENKKESEDDGFDF